MKKEGTPVRVPANLKTQNYELNSYLILIYIL